MGYDAAGMDGRQEGRTGGASGVLRDTARAPLLLWACRARAALRYLLLVYPWTTTATGGGRPYILLYHRDAHAVRGGGDVLLPASLKTVPAYNVTPPSIFYLVLFLIINTLHAALWFSPTYHA